MGGRLKSDLPWLSAAVDVSEQGQHIRAVEELGLGYCKMPGLEMFRHLIQLLSRGMAPWCHCARGAFVLKKRSVPIKR